MPRLVGEAIKETPDTCPYWVLGRYRMATVIWGCGGYGEVSGGHPAATKNEFNRPVEPVHITPSEFICQRCHGTGLFRPPAHRT